MALASISLALACAACGASSESQENTGPDSASTLTEAQSATTGDGRRRCDFSSVRPTYLPWLREGEPVPAPNKYYGPDEAAWLDWRRPDWKQAESPYYVVLRRDSDFTTSSGRLVPGTRIPEADEPGRLYSGEVGFSPVIVWYLVGATSCEWLTLELSAPGMGREQAELEIAKMARSLEPV